MQLSVKKELKKLLDVKEKPSVNIRVVSESSS